ncbi:hypothetical protein HanXRQr2_Chr01g0014281 [Helianthus annuus]|uniref:Iron-sulfur cluster biosynthesis family protein n=1 Tax=Helianthus annuus TaxID=4232 RepID=A0A251VKT3_HELAN|nr:hypothetical protein HanXRQr2_Chr01g0014281 [Helianthus annuus]KAJ0782749.1 hypothetical protein HanLR1_Chr01g0011811 [Helianthus annuus]KAJ0956360.1 hypothetical protein HanPSC8_Chr01g0013861 [Helianthus annuus]
MASISTCFTITPTSYPKPSSIFSRQFHYGVFRTQFLTLRNRNNISKSSSFVSKIRAGSDYAPSAVAPAVVRRPGRIIESDKLPAEMRKRTMEAVDKCGRRVTVGDVASKAGIKLTEAQKALQAIAADSNGFLEVSDEGDILYVFPEDYRSKLASKSLWIKTEPYLEKVKLGAEYLIRVTFGTALIASILIVWTTIIAILTSSRYWDPYYHRRRFQNVDNGMGFIEPVFSFVFGDGDPNEGIEEQRWKMIGQYIGSNDGVVTAEELAPYLDVETVVNTDDDSYILPVLLHFDGQPQVDKEGNILYRFPSLQRTAASKKRSKKELEKIFKDRVGGPRKFFKENKWELSKTSDTERAVIGGLGGLNLFGVIVLSAMLKTVTVVEPSPFISFVYKILPLLQVRGEQVNLGYILLLTGQTCDFCFHFFSQLYAVSFFAIPTTRWFLIQRRNAEIEKRNRARELRAQALQLPDVALKQKILSAQDMSERTVIDQHRIVYTTDKDVSEQDYDKHEWDKRFKDAQ